MMTLSDRSGWKTLLPALLAVAALAPGATPAQDEPAEGTEPPVKQIKMFAENWKWTPAIIRAQPGQKISIEIQNVDSPHRFEIKKLGVKVPLPENETTLVEFVVARPGTYRWFCSRPCGNGCPKMTGKLIVEEP